MSFNKNKREDKDLKKAGFASYEQYRSYRRDTIAAVITMAVIFISPIAIMASSGYSEAGTEISGSYNDDYSDLTAATPSEAIATPSEIAGVEQP